MYTTQPKNFDPVMHLVGEAVFHTHLRPGSNQKEEARSEGMHTGTLSGIASGIAAILTGRRTERYASLEWVPMVDQHHALNLIKRATKLWEELVAQDREEGVTDYQHKKNVEPEFWTAVQGWLEEVTYPEDLQKNEMERHQKAVLAGEESATEADREWLQEKLDSAKKLGKQLEALVRVSQPIPEPMGDLPPRRIKDQPQA